VEMSLQQEKRLQDFEVMWVPGRVYSAVTCGMTVLNLTKKTAIVQFKTFILRLRGIGKVFILGCKGIHPSLQRHRNSIDEAWERHG
jgi:hypothetical protein